MDLRLLTMPAGAAVRTIAREHLAQARAAVPRLSDPADDEALHDFRVALRRLRSCLRAYWNLFAYTVGRKRRRRLRTIARATGAGRDAEVMVGWLRRYRGDRAIPAIEDRERALLAVRDRAYGEARSELGPRMLAVAERLDADFAWYAARLPDGGDPGSGSFAAAAAARLREHAAELGELLRRIPGFDAQRPVHDARIAGKRLRYLLEPLRDEVPAAAALVGRLKDLQDVLGDLHDHHVLLAALDAAGGDADTAELRDTVTAGARALFARFVAGWNRDTAPGFFTALFELIDGLAAAAPREIERKFLLRRLPAAAAAAPWTDIEQGWLPGDVLQERLRRTRDAAGGEHHLRTVKLGRGIERIEVEEACDGELFAALWPLTAGRRVHKRRYRVADPDSALTWEIDAFTDRELYLAEVELDRADREPELPAWLADDVEREVTGDGAFVNVNLAR